MLVPIVISVVISLLLLGLLGALYLRLKSVELDFRVFQVEIKAQLAKLQESASKPMVHVTTPPSTSASTAALAAKESAPLKMAKRALWRRSKDPDLKLASGRLMPSDLFEADPLWKKALNLWKHRFLHYVAVFAVIFSVPFIVDLQQTASIWAVASVVLMGWGVYQRHLFWRIFSVLLLLVAIALYVVLPQLSTAVWIGLSLLISAIILSNRSYVLISSESLFVPVFWGGTLVWFIVTLYPHFHMTMSLKSWIPIGLMGLSLCALLSFIGDRFKPHKAWIILPYLLIPIAGLVLILYRKWFLMPSEGLGVIAWPVVMISGLIVLKLFERAPKEDHNFLHALWFLILIGGLTWETVSWGHSLLGTDLTDTWSAILRAMVPTLGLLSVLLLGHFIEWPLQQHYKAYYWLGTGAVALYLVLWSILVNMFTSGLTQFDYTLLFNPLDLMIMFVTITLAVWIYGVQLNIKKSRFTSGWMALLVVLFVWFSGMALRYGFHKMGVPFEWGTVIARHEMIRVFGIAWGIYAALLVFVWIGVSRSGLKA
ncbi:MAG: DUF2339 domain-containing protein [Gammaproteobacteria bacterium]